MIGTSLTQITVISRCWCVQFLKQFHNKAKCSLSSHTYTWINKTQKRVNKFSTATIAATATTISTTNTTTTTKNNNNNKNTIDNYDYDIDGVVVVLVVKMLY
jgi:hypothetical protein